MCKIALTHTNYCPPDKSNYKNYSQQSNPTGLLQRPTITLFYSHRDPDPTPVILLTTERPWLDSADTGAGLVTIAWRTTSLACYTHPFSSPLRGTTRNIVQGKLLWTKAGEEQTGFRAEKNRKASVWISWVPWRQWVFCSRKYWIIWSLSKGWENTETIYHPLTISCLKSEFAGLENLPTLSVVLLRPAFFLTVVCLESRLRLKG